MTRQYVGARYVPMFANPIEWTNTAAYEPLTIVTHNGNSYTSKKYAPAGISITNTDYWVLTGAYNAQISQLSTEVSSLEKLNNNPFINVLQGKRIAICGASNEMQQQISGEDRWPAKMAAMLNGVATVTILGEGGAPLSDIIQQVSNAINTADIILICPASNDASNDVPLGGPTSATSTYWSNFIALKAIIDANPNKKFYMRGPTVTTEARKLSFKFPLAAYRNMCVVGCAFSGCQYVDGLNWYGNITENNIADVTADGLHFISPATNTAAYNGVLMAAGALNNNGESYTGFLKNITVNNTDYAQASDLVTLDSTYCHYYSTASQAAFIRFEKEYVTVNIRIVTDAEIPALTPFATVDSDLMSMFNLVSNPGVGYAVKLTTPVSNYQAELVGSTSKIWALDTIPTNTGVRIDIRLPIDAAFDGAY